MDLCAQNTSKNSTAAPPQTDPVVIAKSDESGKRGRKDNDTRKVSKKKRALPLAKRMKELKEELGGIGKELKQFNAALPNIQSALSSSIIEMRMGVRLELQKMARELDELILDKLDAIEEVDKVPRKMARQDDEIILDILDAIEEVDFVKVYDLLQILFST